VLFATGAAHKLGGLGEDTQVFRVDENGAVEPVDLGLDPYPPTSQGIVGPISATMTACPGACMKGHAHRPVRFRPAA